MIDNLFEFSFILHAESRRIFFRLSRKTFSFFFLSFMHFFVFAFLRPSLFFLKPSMSYFSHSPLFLNLQWTLDGFFISFEKKLEEMRADLFLNVFYFRDGRKSKLFFLVIKSLNFPQRPKFYAFVAKFVPLNHDKITFCLYSVPLFTQFGGKKKYKKNKTPVRIFNVFGSFRFYSSGKNGNFLV